MGMNTPASQFEARDEVPVPAERQATGLTVDEMRTVEDLMSMMLPEPIHAGMTVDIAGYMDERLAAETEVDFSFLDDAPSIDDSPAFCDVLLMYRSGIQAIQGHCEAKHGKAFQDLERVHKHAVLEMLREGCPAVGLQDHAPLFDILASHAAEAYFQSTGIGLLRRSSNRPSTATEMEGT